MSVGGIWSQRISGWSAAYPAETAWLYAPKDWAPGGRGNRRIILANHGHGGSDAWGSDVSLFDPTYHVWQLVRAGYVVMALNNLGQAAFGSPAVMRNLDDAYAWCVGTALMPTAKVGVLGWSMGGGTSLNWIVRNRAKIAASWLWTPLADLDWANATAGYAPGYSLGAVGWPGGYSAELTTAYAASTTATTGTGITIPAAGSGQTVTVSVADAKGFADGTGPTLPQATTLGTAFTWQSKDDTHLYGCVSTGAAVSPKQGDAVTSSFAQQKHGYSPMLRVADLRALGFPLTIATAVNDNVVPPAQAPYLVTQVADPQVKFRSVASGAHTNLFAYVPFDEHQALYESGKW